MNGSRTKGFCDILTLFLFAPLRSSRWMCVLQVSLFRSLFYMALVPWHFYCSDPSVSIILRAYSLFLLCTWILVFPQLLYTNLCLVVLVQTKLLFLTKLVSLVFLISVDVIPNPDLSPFRHILSVVNIYSFYCHCIVPLYSWWCGYKSWYMLVWRL